MSEAKSKEDSSNYLILNQKTIETFKNHKTLNISSSSLSIMSKDEKQSNPLENKLFKKDSHNDKSQFKIKDFETYSIIKELKEKDLKDLQEISSDHSCIIAWKAKTNKEKKIHKNFPYNQSKWLNSKLIKNLNNSFLYRRPLIPRYGE